MRPIVIVLQILLLGVSLACRPADDAASVPGETLADQQIAGIHENRHDVFRWGPDTDVYVSWNHHSNRLIPVYTFGTRHAAPGVDLDGYRGVDSVYRSAEALTGLYGRLPSETVNPAADYFDQTDLARIQQAAAAAGKRHVFLVVFDGMDWQTTRAAAIYRGAVTYDDGRGYGLHFQDHDAAGSSQFGFMVTAPSDNRMRGDPDTQQVADSGSGLYGGYDPMRGGDAPWVTGSDPGYIIAEDFDGEPRHAWTDSAASATSIFSGIKTYNRAINVDPSGGQLAPVARTLQQAGYAVGIVTSVPISHATPAAAYGNNVSRHDYQDLTRDLLGLPSVAHPDSPLDGVDVLIGCGDGVERDNDSTQGRNFVPGNAYLTDDDLRSIDSAGGGRYVVSRRTAGVNGAEALAAAAATAVRSDQRLLGFYGTPYAHLPYRTADGHFDPVAGEDDDAESYSTADVVENPTLAQMTAAALTVLGARDGGFWLLVEAGDVDWANHATNLDNSVGAVLSGDDAVRVITDWVAANSNWHESLMIVTADHGHYLVLVEPARLATAG